MEISPCFQLWIFLPTTCARSRTAQPAWRSPSPCGLAGPEEGRAVPSASSLFQAQPVEGKEVLRAYT